MAALRRAMTATTGAVCAAALAAGVATAASPVSGSIAGPITAVKGSTFAVKTSLSPTGSSKVSVSAKTSIVEQSAGTRADLKQGVCVQAFGTKKGSTVAASRITVSTGGACAAPGAGKRPSGQKPPSGGKGAKPPAGTAKPPASMGGMAAGTISSVSGSTLLVKSGKTTTKVTVSSKTQIAKTATVSASALAKSLCAFVQGTSADKGVTVAAQRVSLSKAVAGSCTATGPQQP